MPNLATPPQEWEDVKHKFTDRQVQFVEGTIQFSITRHRPQKVLGSTFVIYIFPSGKATVMEPDEDDLRKYYEDLLISGRVF